MSAERAYQAALEQNAMEHIAIARHAAPFGTDAQQASQQAQVLTNPWELTPRWHWRRWFGWSLRRENRIVGSELVWEYGRPRQVAREALARKYDAPPQGAGVGRQRAF